MASPQLNFRGLRRLYGVFLFRVWLHRVRMILVRLALVLGLAYLAYLVFGPTDVHISYNGSDELNLGPIIAIPIVLWLGTVALLGVFWQQFAQDNHASLANVTVGAHPSNSFTKRLLALSFAPIEILVGERKAYMSVAFYKEGGVLRWREYKLDFAIRYQPEPAVVLPHVIADATLRDAFKGSNLQRHFAGYVSFRAEGAAGSNYRLLADPAHTADALAILTPDVLQAFLDRLPGADVEFKDGSIWFLYRNFACTEAQLQAFVDGTERAMNELEKQLRPYQSGAGSS